jgi:hypothetical protein
VKAVILLLALLTPLALAVAVAAGADGGCVITPTGIDCSAEGASSTSGGTPGTTIPGLPLRYLATTEPPDDGLCWFWSPYPPGLDSWDPANDMEILWTRWALPECPDGLHDTETPGTSWAETRAWEVFRSFPLAAPHPALQPGRHGITGLPSYLSASLPSPLAHHEALPDGSTMEVTARVTAVVIDWGDGSPAFAYPPADLLPWPGGRAHHTYALKTCPAGYRATHPSGGNCHPLLEAYPITVTFRWAGRYRLGAGWVELGLLDRTTSLPYDVDEVIGVLRP